MCPDKELLSAWYDGEVEEPWNGELEKHISQCEKCASLIEEFAGLTGFLQKDGVTLSRFRKREIHRQVMHQHRRSRIIPLWQRSVPWPIAAAAVLILGISLLLPGAGGMFMAPAPAMAQAGEEDLSAMDGLIPIVLPPEQTFAYYGDSQLTKSVSYDKDVP